MNHKISDLEFSKKFKAPVAEDYEFAIEFLTIKPDVSLSKFRGILESFCKQIADYKKIVFTSNNLYRKIESLCEYQIINDSFKDALHELREICNEGVHKSNFNKAESEEESIFQRNVHQKLLDNANKARTLVTKIFESTFLLLNPEKELPNYELVSIGKQEHREILYNAVTSLCSKQKFKAGLLYESMAHESVEKGQIIISSELSYHRQSLYKLAANCYEASYKISANVDINHKRYLLLNLDVEEIINRFCDTEALFRYALLAYQGKLGKEQEEKGGNMLKIAADRGHSRAAAYYGVYLYEDIKDYTLSLKYLNKAIENDEPFAYNFLYYYYSDGRACSVNAELALANIQKGIDLGDADSLQLLGEAYHEGKIVKKNNAKAEQLLNEAIEKGSLKALHYYRFTFKDFLGEFEKELQDRGKSILAECKRIKSKRTIRNVEKIGRNEMCPCESGKKFKKCCGSS
jgi:TPR repeat protein